MTADQAEHPIAESGRRPIYVERVNAVIDYIEAHIAEELTLEKLAEVAHFSPITSIGCSAPLPAKLLAASSAGSE